MGVSGMLNVNVPFGAFITLDAMGPSSFSRKSRPGRDTRTDAAFSTAFSAGKPPGSGVMPAHPPHPPHPPPLQEAIKRKKTTPKMWRKRESMNSLSLGETQVPPTRDRERSPLNRPVSLL